MKLSAKTGVALTITALSLVVTVGAGASRPADRAEEDPYLRHAAFRISGPRRPDEPASQPDRGERDQVGLVTRAGERPGERRPDPSSGS